MRGIVVYETRAMNKRYSNRANHKKDGYRKLLNSKHYSKLSAELFMRVRGVSQSLSQTGGLLGDAE